MYSPSCGQAAHSGPRRLLRVLTWVAAIVLMLYGTVLTAVGVAVESGLVRHGAHADLTALRWHALLSDPWFLLSRLLLMTGLVLSRPHTAPTTSIPPEPLTPAVAVSARRAAVIPARRPGAPGWPRPRLGPSPSVISVAGGPCRIHARALRDAFHTVPGGRFPLPGEPAPEFNYPSRRPCR